MVKLVIQELNLWCGPVMSTHLRLAAVGPVREQYLPRPEQPQGAVMQVKMTDTQEGDLAYGDPVDKKGFKTSVEKGSVVWKSSDEKVATVTGVSESPISATFKAVGPGDCFVWPEADADLGEGVLTLVGEKVAINVSSGQAVGIAAPVVSALREQVDDGAPQ